MTPCPGVMSSSVNLKIPGDPQYVSVVRLAVAGFANQVDCSPDEAEDLKLAITEACSYVLRSAKFEVTVQVNLDFSAEHLEMRVDSTVREPVREWRWKPEAPVPEADDEEMDESAVDFDVGWSLVEALMDVAEIESDEKMGTVSLRLARRRA